MNPTVAFRINQEDKRLLEAAAKQARRSLSDWMRLALVDAACDALPQEELEKLGTEQRANVA